jgi:hypothetical protein
MSALHADELKSKPDRFGKQTRRFDSPRRQSVLFLPVAFIFRERRSAMVNRWFLQDHLDFCAVPRVNLPLN